TYIFYSSNGEFDYRLINMYFLVIYKNKAFTNVELTSEVSTIETIKNFIKSVPESQTFNIVEGKVETNSEILRKRAEQYLDSFIYTYYTTNPAELYPSESYSIDYSNSKEYITTNITDFSIYTSYTENFIDSSKQLLLCKFIERLRPYENFFYISMPICMVL